MLEIIFKLQKWNNKIKGQVLGNIYLFEDKCCYKPMKTKGVLMTIT